MRLKVLILLFAVLASAQTIIAEGTKIGGLCYKLNLATKTAEVTYKGNSYYNSYPGIESIEIPAFVKHKGTIYTVTSIGEHAFHRCENLRTVSIPNTVTIIGNSAFDHSGIEMVEIPNSVKSIGCAAFSFSGLTKIVIPNSVTRIGPSAFWCCPLLNSITIPNSITTIERYTFAGCSSLTRIIIPNSVTSIGVSAFYNCSSLTSVTIPNSVTSIGNGAFNGCDRAIVYVSSNIIISDIPSRNIRRYSKPEHENQQNQQYVAPIEVRNKSDIDTNIPETRKSNPNTFVVIFANEDYKNVASVPYAKNDGSILRKYCQKTLGIPASNIHYIENSTYNDMRIQLSWLENVCDAYAGKASIIIYYAGHGIPDENSKSAYLLPVDGDARFVQSAYKLDDFY